MRPLDAVRKPALAWVHEILMLFALRHPMTKEAAKRPSSWCARAYLRSGLVVGGFDSIQGFGLTSKERNAHNPQGGPG